MKHPKILRQNYAHKVIIVFVSYHTSFLHDEFDSANALITWLIPVSAINTASHYCGSLILYNDIINIAR